MVAAPGGMGILHLRGPQGTGCHAFAKQKHVLNDPPHAFASESVAPIYNNDAKCSRARGNEMPRIPTVFLSAWVQPSGPGSACRQATARLPCQGAKPGYAEAKPGGLPASRRGRGPSQGGPTLHLSGPFMGLRPPKAGLDPAL